MDLPETAIAGHPWLDILERTANCVRGTKARPFYSHRELAAFFKVQQRTVHLACKELAAKGLLICQRSSVTLVTGRKPKPLHPPLAVVGMPVWMPGLGYFRDWRTFFSEMDDQLRQHNFVADAIFYRGSAAEEQNFAQKILSHGVDYLVWFTPLPQYLQVMQIVADRGVAIRVISHPDARLPFPTYLLEREHAAIQGLREWKRQGITHVVIPYDKHPDFSGKDRDMIIPCIQRAGLSYSFITPLLDGWDAHRSSLMARTAGVVLANEYLVGQLCDLDTQNMVDLLKATRVMSFRRFSLPRKLMQDGLYMDLVATDWAALAKLIANDIATQKAPNIEAPCMIRALWQPRIPARPLLFEP